MPSRRSVFCHLLVYPHHAVTFIPQLPLPSSLPYQTRTLHSSPLSSRPLRRPRHSTSTTTRPRTAPYYYISVQCSTVTPPPPERSSPSLPPDEEDNDDNINNRNAAAADDTTSRQSEQPPDSAQIESILKAIRPDTESSSPSSSSWLDDQTTLPPSPSSTSSTSSTSSFYSSLSTPPPSSQLGAYYDTNGLSNLSSDVRYDANRSNYPYQVPGAYELNESFQSDYMQRHRQVVAPDEAFGAIFMWDVVMANARDLELTCWHVVAKEQGWLPPDLSDIVRAEFMAPEAAISRVFYWTTDWSETKRVVFRKHEILSEIEPTFQWETSDGIHRFLSSLIEYGVKCILCAGTRRRDDVQRALQSVGLESVFTQNEIVAADDEFDSIEQMLLLASMKGQRPPEKCVIFADKPEEITAAHEITAKVIAKVGAHPAYEVKSADHVIKDFDELVVYNMRRLFSGDGSNVDVPNEPEPELELERK